MKNFVDKQTDIAVSRLLKIRRDSERLEFDEKREQRKLEALCPICYYLNPTHLGSMAKIHECSYCGCTYTETSMKNQLELCVDCAIKLEVCRACNSEIDLQKSRLRERREG